MKKFTTSILAALLIVSPICATQLTDALVLPFEPSTPVNTLPVLASIKIYRGSAVGTSGGYARQLVAGDNFKGFAEQNVDNSAGASGALNVQVRHSGIVLLTVSTAGYGDPSAEGLPVYATDGNTYTITNTSGTSSRVGTIHRFVSTNTCMVKFNADSQGDSQGVTTLSGSFTSTLVGTNGNIAIIADTNLTSINTMITNANRELGEIQTKLNELIKSHK